MGYYALFCWLIETMAYFCKNSEQFDIKDSLKIVDAEIVDKYVVSIF